MMCICLSLRRLLRTADGQRFRRRAENWRKLWKGRTLRRWRHRRVWTPGILNPCTACFRIARFRELYDLLQNGEYDRLTDPRSGLAAWQQTAPDKSEALVNVVTGLTRSNDAFLTVYPRRLDAEAVYSVNGEWSDTGAALMYGGIPLPQEKGDFRAMQFHLVREDA